MGAISARAAMKLSYYRGTMASKLARSPSAYCMAAIGLSEQEMSKEIEEMENLQADQNSCQITISCVNSSTSTTISGPVTQVESLVARLKNQQIFTRKLQVSVGYHSPQMMQVESEYLHLISTIERGTSSTRCQMVSSVAGVIISTGVLCTPQYWVQNMVSKVDLLGAVQRHLNKVSVNSWLEIGPYAALQGPIRNILTSLKKARTSITYNSVLFRDKSAVHTLLEAMGHLYCQGSVTDLSKVDVQISNAARHPAVLTDLPQYTYDHSVLHWHESRLNREHWLRKHPHNELLGTRAIDWNPQNAKWNKVINLNDMSWAKDHRINGSILYPAAGILSMAIEAMKQLDDDSNNSAVGYELKDVVFSKPLILSTHRNAETQISLRSPKDQVQNKPGNIYEFCVSVYKEEEPEVGFQKICCGYVRADHGRIESEVDHGKEDKKHLERLRDLVAAAEKSVDQEIDSWEMYRILKEAGIDHGSAFQPLRSIQINNNSESIGKVGHLELFKYLQSNIIHPTILVGLFQMAFVSIKWKLVLNDKSGLQTEIAQKLEQHIKEMGELLENNYIVLIELDHPVIRNISAKEFEAIQILFSTARFFGLHQETQEFGEGQPLQLSVKTPGLIDSIEFIEDRQRSEPLGADEVEIEVHATGVNFRDLLQIIGKVASDVYGCGGAGIVTRVGENCTQFCPGDRVMMTGRSVFKSYARCHWALAMKIPTSLTFPQAASIPVAFTTAWYSLNEASSLQPGGTVLIHSGAGGTGQALIQVAQLLGSEIFTTVSSAKKKQYLMEMYDIREDHIFFRRDDSFADGIMRMTQGKGVDVVVNSVSGEKLAATWECIAPFGRMIEIGLGDVFSHGKLDMYPFARNTTFATVNLDMAAQRPLMMSKPCRKIMELVAENKLRPFNPLEVLSISDLAKALRALQGDQINTMDPNATYLVAGGLGGLGRSIARWLVASGAQIIILVSRSVPQKDKAQQLLIELKSQGVRVETPQCDITDLPSLQSMIDECASKMPPIKGCFQAAMVLKDARFVNMKFQEWEHCVNPKISGSWNLHTVLPQGMDFFVLLSSTVGIIGHVGQSNYAAGNTYQDALAQFRVSNGEKATAIDLGVVLGAGFVAENPGVRETLQQIGSILPLDLEKLFALFDLYCDPKLQFQSPIHSQVVNGLGIPSQIIAEVAEAGLLVANALRSNLSKILGIPEYDIELRNRVESYGIDSLVAVELRNWFGREMGADLAVFEILGANFLAVGLTVATKSSFRKN
ncbi:hypothetical protein BCON_0267g00180 [Botryotinia convoluta]|uniref:Uncharacterized protein n=1 Tax=Botryotinia convoluta TaxID=54673 RepID=A0A4Z1HS75_9HELO|nr:hypothetical protein BCON_0267g00180 [Botryotinia convoluta]